MGRRERREGRTITVEQGKALINSSKDQPFYGTSSKLSNIFKWYDDSQDAVLDQYDLPEMEVEEDAGLR